MKEKSLGFYCSPKENPPTFVIPIFLSKIDNGSFAQDLTSDGIVKKFQYFKPDLFFPVPALAPAITIGIGEPGLSAFWLDDLTVLVGTLDTLRLQIAQIDEAELPPFVAVEALTLVGDIQRLSRSADHASSLLSGRSAIGYRDRIISRYNMINKLQSKPTAQHAESSLKIDDLIKRLQAISKSEEWFYAWSSGWFKFDKDKRLFDIAKWRINEFKAAEFTSRIISLILSAKYRNEALEIAEKWLSISDLRTSGWGSIWINIYNSKFQRNVKLEELGLNYLKITSEYTKFSPNYSWCIVWDRIWKTGEYLDDLESISIDITRRTNKYSDSFVEFVVNPFASKHPDKRWAMDYMRNWLLTPKSNSLWVQSYMQFSKRLQDPSLNKSAIDWLHRLGAGMNLWKDLWTHCSQFISQEQSINLAERWLLHSRKDLSSWPRVFMEILHKQGNIPSPSLARSARLWVDFHQGQKRNFLIERAAEIREAN
ncbi:hypothetical protein ACWIEX_01720 [Bosea sp. NPDC055353]